MKITKITHQDIKKYFDDNPGMRKLLSAFITLWMVYLILYLWFEWFNLSIWKYFNLSIDFDTYLWFLLFLISIYFTFISWKIISSLFDDEDKEILWDEIEDLKKEKYFLKKQNEKLIKENNAFYNKIYH